MKQDESISSEIKCMNSNANLDLAQNQENPPRQCALSSHLAQKSQQTNELDRSKQPRVEHHGRQDGSHGLGAKQKNAHIPQSRCRARIDKTEVTPSYLASTKTTVEKACCSCKLVSFGLARHPTMTRRKGMAWLAAEQQKTAQARTNIESFQSLTTTIEP
jgi:hypothetical protein